MAEPKHEHDAVIRSKTNISRPLDGINGEFNITRHQGAMCKAGDGKYWVYERLGPKDGTTDSVRRKVELLSATIRVEEGQRKVDAVDLDGIPVNTEVQPKPPPPGMVLATLHTPHLLPHMMNTQPEVIKCTDEEWFKEKKNSGNNVVQNMASGVKITFLDVETKKVETWSRQQYPRAVSNHVTVKDLAEKAAAHAQMHPYTPIRNNCQSFVVIIDGTLGVTPARLDPLRQTTTNVMTFAGEFILEGPRDAALTSQNILLSPSQYSHESMDTSSFSATHRISTPGSILNTDPVHDGGTYKNQDASRHQFPSASPEHTEEMPPADSFAPEGPDLKHGRHDAFKDDARSSTEHPNANSGPQPHGRVNRKGGLDVVIPIGGAVASAAGAVFGSGSTVTVTAGVTSSGLQSVTLTVGIANPLVGAGIFGGAMLVGAGMLAYQTYTSMREKAPNEEQGQSQGQART